MDALLDANQKDQLVGPTLFYPLTVCK